MSRLHMLLREQKQWQRAQQHLVSLHQHILMPKGSAIITLHPSGSRGHCHFLSTAFWAHSQETQALPLAGFALTATPTNTQQKALLTVVLRAA